jgi:hypothetical protein
MSGENLMVKLDERLKRFDRWREVERIGNSELQIQKWDHVTVTIRPIGDQQEQLRLSWSIGHSVKTEDGEFEFAFAMDALDGLDDEALEESITLWVRAEIIDTVQDLLYSDGTEE